MGVRRALIVMLCIAGAPVHAQDAPTSPNEPDPYDEAAEHPVFDTYAPRIFAAPPRVTAPPDDTKLAPTGVLQGAGRDAWPALYRDGALTVEGSLAGGLGLFAFRHNQFQADDGLTPYATNPQWSEFFVQPGVSAQWRIRGGLSLYGSVSYMETATRGLDYHAVDNTWHGEREQLYAGGRWEDRARDVQVDVSYGQQNLVLGESFLLASGASNGAQRGATFIGPRTAWANAAIAKVTAEAMTAQAFWLKPNEASSADTGTRLAGAEVEWDRGALRGAAAYLYVPESAIATRDGMSVYDLRVRWHPSRHLPTAWLSGEYALERNAGVSASGWYAAANWNGKDLPWQPLVVLRYTFLSGDKPGTATWEGFDPLYFGGGNPDWYQGKLGSSILNNTNLVTAVATVTLTPDERNIVQLVALDFRAAQANAPLAIPDPNAPLPAGGPPARALATEIDATWTYTFSKSLNVSIFGAYAWVGSGYKAWYASRGGAARDWSGVGVQVNVNY